MTRTERWIWFAVLLFGSGFSAVVILLDSTDPALTAIVLGALIVSSVAAANAGWALWKTR